MNQGPSGKRVLAVGGETRLGRALAIGLAEAGVDVAIASLSSGTEAEFAINSALNELWAMGRQGLAFTVDASDPAQLRGAVKRAERELGRIDLAAVVAVDESEIALDALRAALDGRSVIELPPGTEAPTAVREISETLGG